MYFREIESVRGAKERHDESHRSMAASRLKVVSAKANRIRAEKRDKKGR